MFVQYYYARVPGTVVYTAFQNPGRRRTTGRVHEVHVRGRSKI
jgi:hypothetical protein